MRKDRILRCTVPDDGWDVRSQSEPTTVLGNFMDFSNVPRVCDDNSLNMVVIPMSTSAARLKTPKKLRSDAVEHPATASMVPGFPGKITPLGKQNNVDQQNTTPRNTLSGKRTKQAKDESSKIKTSIQYNSVNHPSHKRTNKQDRSPSASGDNKIVKYVKEATEISKPSANAPPKVIRKRLSPSPVTTAAHTASKRPPNLPKPEKTLTNDIVPKVSAKTMKAS